MASRNINWIDLNNRAIGVLTNRAMNTVLLGSSNISTPLESKCAPGAMAVSITHLPAGFGQEYALSTSRSPRFTLPLYTHELWDHTEVS
jgi:hypothetical protein